MSDRVSVAEAAEILHVHPQRVHQRIRAGSLAAEKVGNQWVIRKPDVLRIGRPRAGRPLSSKSAWDLLAVAMADGAAGDLSPSARSRARSRLQALLARVDSSDRADVAIHLAHALGNRAERALLFASARDLPDVRADSRIHEAGISDPRSNLSAASVAEGYVAAGDLDDLVDEYLLSPAHGDRANVILHVLPPGLDHPALVDLGKACRSPLVLAADLAEHDGVRERGEALRVLAELRDRLPLRTARRGGAHA